MCFGSFRKKKSNKNENNPQIKIFFNEKFSNKLQFYEYLNKKKFKSILSSLKYVSFRFNQKFQDFLKKPSLQNKNKFNRNNIKRIEKENYFQTFLSKLVLMEMIVQNQLKMYCRIVVENPKEVIQNRVIIAF